MISGGIWCCATCCLFLANDLLTQTVTYPVLITIPGCVATAWSLVYFREIKMVSEEMGKKSILLFPFLESSQYTAHFDRFLPHFHRRYVCIPVQA
jgi:hypothetical protein